MALLWLSVPLKDGAARSVITVTTSCERYLSGCRVGAAVSVCRWPAVTSRRTPGSGAPSCRCSGTRVDDADAD